MMNVVTALLARCMLSTQHGRTPRSASLSNPPHWSQNYLLLWVLIELVEKPLLAGPVVSRRGHGAFRPTRPLLVAALCWPTNDTGVSIQYTCMVACDGCARQRFTQLWEAGRPEPLGIFAEKEECMIKIDNCETLPAACATTWEFSRPVMQGSPSGIESPMQRGKEVPQPASCVAWL